METLGEALAWLDRHLNREVQMSAPDADALAAMRGLAQALGDPQLDVPVIQITGTNGKGSTAAMITGLLSSLGLTVGTYTSPHVVDVRERIQRNGESIEPDELVAVLTGLRRVVEANDLAPSWFDLLTAAAYWWFADQAVDVAVVEVGMLGRHDSTSIVEPVVAVITNIGYDHTDGAPGWRRTVAYEKAGIVGPGSILCLGEPDEELEEVFVAEHPARLLRRNTDFECLDNTIAVGGRMVSLRTPTGLYDEVFVSLHGAHQGDNAAVALTAAEAFVGAALPDDVVHEAFASLSLPGRLEVIGHDPLIVLDGAHNPQAAEALAHALVETFGERRRILVIGAMADKAVGGVLEELDLAEAELVVCTQADTPRAMPAEVLAALVEEFGAQAEAVATPGGALERARAVADDDDMIVCTGSLWLVGAVRAAHDQRSG
jgi:dihydrofolate synthase/folylpolyglutamate synthase